MHPSPRHRGSVVLEVLVVLGVVAVLAVAVFGALRRTTTASWDSRGRRNQCMSNVRQMTITVQIYSQDHNGKYPAKDTIWADVNFPPKTLTCPTYGNSQGNGYGYNQWVSGKSFSSSGIPSPQSLVLLADSAKPDHLLTANVDIDPRHLNQATMGYADGHVALAPPSAAGIARIGNP